MVGEGTGSVAPAAHVDSNPVKSLMPSVCVIGALTHLVFLGVFLANGLAVLVAVNIASIAVYVGVFELERRTHAKPLTQFALVSAEIIGHATIATIYIGWNSGFHHYILLLVPVAAVSAIHPRWLKSAAVASGLVGYVALDLWLRLAAPPHTLPGRTLESLYYFNLVATLLILAALAARYYMLINETQVELQVLASTDALTQIRNRSALTELIQREQSRANRGHPLAFIMCDLDHFKAVNDRAGHAAGDVVLQAVSSSMAGSIRDTDYLGRWGGEEFLVVLPDADANAATAVAERIRADVAALPVIVEGTWRTTVTMGVAALGPGETADSAIARADAALYAGKRAGRNRVVTADAAPLPDWQGAPTTQ